MHNTSTQTIDIITAITTFVEHQRMCNGFPELSNRIFLLITNRASTKHRSMGFTSILPATNVAILRIFNNSGPHIVR